MSNDVLKAIAESLPSVNDNIAKLEDLIAYMDGVKQPTMQLKQDLTKLRVLRDDHVRELKKRGLLK